MTVYNASWKSCEAYLSIKDGYNSDAASDTARDDGGRILWLAQEIAAIVKSQRVGTSTLQTPLKYLFHTQ